MTRTTFALSAVLAALLTSPGIASDRLARFDAEAARAVADRLGLTEVSVHPDDKGADLEGRLPGGLWIELDFHRDGSLEDLEADKHALIPVSEVVAVLPEALLSADRFPADALFEKIELEDDGYEIEGRDAQGRWFKADYDRHARLEEWKFD